MSVVGLTLAYSNPNPQLDSLLERLSGSLPARTGNPGPSWTDTADTAGGPEVSYGHPPRSLDKRFSPEARAALSAAFASGVKQKDLAREHGISIRSVKRLIRQARIAGTPEGTWEHLQHNPRPPDGRTDE